MSSLVQEAILDAKKIREAAKKVALNSLKEKYSTEFKKSFKDQLRKISEAPEGPDKKEDEGDDLDLPDFDMDMGGGEDKGGGAGDDFDPFADMSASSAPPSGGDITNDQNKQILDKIPTSFDKEVPDDTVIEIDLGEIVSNTEESLQNDVGEVDRKSLASEEPPSQTGLPGDSYKDEDEDLDSEMDFGKNKKDEDDDKEFSLTQESLESYLDIEDRLNSKLISYESDIRMLSSHLKQVAKENKELKRRLKATNETLYKSNLENAKLVYKNQILVDASLNERQKKSMLESINKLNDDEVEVLPNLYSIVKEAVGAADNKGRKKESLTEILNSRNATFIGGKSKEQENKEEVNEGFKKWQKLAKLISE
jgi:hypothetical protein